jgi:hypothetical protein
MGGIMPYDRATRRNHLAHGDYNGPEEDIVEAKLDLIRGDLRRFEDDMLLPYQIKLFARVSGATEAECERLIRFMLGIEEPGCADCAEMLDFNGNRHARCYFHNQWRVEGL